MALDDLKDIWKNQKQDDITFSENDIVKMIHKNSTSIVKWIFIISIIEFLLLIVVPFFYSGMNDVEKIMESQAFILVLNLVSYAIAIYFMIQFYLNYKQISVNDSTKKLMGSILKTRRTVKNYVITQLAVGSMLLIYMFSKITKSDEIVDKLPEDFNTLYLWLILLGVGAFVILLVWLFYKLLYGILLSKLKINYSELDKQE